MAKGIPHSALVQANLTSYLDDARKGTNKVSKKLSSQSEFVGIFRNSIAAYSVLTKFSRGSRVNLLNTAASTVRRCPLLIAFGQISLARMEVRRFVESASRFPYFLEHPVEWNRVLSDPEVGTARDDNDPIGWCAARDQRWYVNYIKMRFTDKSGLIKTSIDAYLRLYKELSTDIHVTKDASQHLQIADAIDVPKPNELKEFRESQRAAYKAGLITALAATPKQLNKLTAIERSWFDWLLGAADSKAVSGGAFLSV